MGFANIFWLVFSVFVWGFIHSLTASLQFKAVIRRVYGPSADRYYRLAYNAFSAVSLIVVLIIAAFTPDRTLYVATFPWVALLIIIELLAAAALIVGLWQADLLDFLGVRPFLSHKRKEASKLVENGLYHYVRHPTHTALLIFIWSLPLMTARLLVLDLALTVYMVAGTFFEERKMRQKFGHEFTEYAAVTPMFIPFLKKTKLPKFRIVR